jgi:hypothetical protein
VNTTSVTTKSTAGRLALAMLLAVAGIAAAGEAPPAGAPPAGGAEANTEKAPQVEETFNFVPGDRRDPFTFTKVVPKLATPTSSSTNPDEDQTQKRMDAAQIAAKKSEALNYYSMAESALMDMNAAESMARCDRGLEVFKDVQMNLYKELQEVRDVLLRLRKAAERIRQRQDAERDFSQMNLHLTGVVARDKNSQAIINAKVVTKGDVVPSSTEGVDIVVADILPQQVVFIYRGYKMMLTLSEIGR